MVTAEDVYAVVEEKGPIIGNKIKQELGAADATLINVFLTQLKDEGRIRLTSVKLGSSSFAYTKEQREKLVDLIQYLNEKDRRVAERLRKEKLMRGSQEDPLTRVALTQIKDYAIPVKVKTNSGEEIFHRWFLHPSSEAQATIKEMMKPKTKPKEKQEKTETKPEEKKTEKPTKKQAAEPEKQRKLQKATPESDFAKVIENYCQEKDIDIIDIKEVRKNSELDLIVEMPTAVGRIKHYAKAKKKKKSNDGDLAAAILAGKKRMLPTLYFTTGTVTKKALANPELQEITVVEIGNSHQ